MKKIILSIIFTFVLGICILFMFDQKAKDLSFHMDSIELAIYLNDEKTSTIPSKTSGYYYDREKTSCTNGAYINWDSITWSPVVNNVTSYPTRCEIYFTTNYTEGILNGMDPVLKDELVPVTIDNNGTVKKADLESKWYSYEEKKWANAVVLKEYDLYDLSSNHFNGKLMNGATIVTDSSGKKAISFDGVDDYVDIVDIPNTVNFEGGFTVEFEAVWETFHNFSRIFDFSDEKLNYQIFVSNNYDNGDFLIGGRMGDKADSSLNTTITNQISLNQKAQYKFEYVKENSQNVLKYYKNGSLIQTINKGTLSNKNTLYTNNYLGRSAWDGNPGSLDEYFDGLIYSIKITDSSGTPILWYDLNNENTLKAYTYQESEIIPESAIESYFVWIPKYRYQLWDLGNYDSLTSIDTSKVHEIPIIFGDYDTSDSKEGECTTPMKSGESGNCKVGDYMTHPAFISIPSTGFWVGKFETGYDGATTKGEAEQNVNDSSKVVIKPNVYSWRNIQVANAFYTSYNYKRNLDSHMMKNTEWGAVAYLQHSKYGSSSSVRINNDKDQKTGLAAINEPTCNYTTTNESCNIYCTDGTCNTAYPNSVLASTTNNISGIFDMSGGAWDYVMGVLVDEDGRLVTGKNSKDHSGFNGVLGCPTCDNDTSGLTELTNGYDWPEEKYYDKYVYSISREEYFRRILGDATAEAGPGGTKTYNGHLRMVGSWYDDSYYMVYNEASFFWRGGESDHGTDAGIFSSAYRQGITNIGGAFRIILTPV